MQGKKKYETKILKFQMKLLRKNHKYIKKSKKQNQIHRFLFFVWLFFYKFRVKFRKKLRLVFAINNISEEIN